MGGGGGGGFNYSTPTPSKIETEKKVKSIQSKTLEQLREAGEKNKAKRIKEMVTTSHPNEIGVVYLNAGQGDATIVRLPNGKVMVIDCNIDNSPENITEYLKNAGVKKIDYLVITHPHYDHMSGMKEIADNFEVGEVWTTRFRRTKESETPESYEKVKEYHAQLKRLHNKGTKINIPTAKNAPAVEEGKLKIKVLGPSYSSQGKNEDIHEESMALQIKFGKTSLVFTGDTPNNGLDRIKNYYNVKNTTVWHASHHGSREGANEEVLKEANPKYTVIPVGKGNYHGHPHAEAKKIYGKYTEKKVYRTDEGNIGFRFNSEGDSVDVQE
jgi:competence protein ComEC